MASNSKSDDLQPKRVSGSWAFEKCVAVPMICVRSDLKMSTLRLIVLDGLLVGSAPFVGRERRLACFLYELQCCSSHLL